MMETFDLAAAFMQTKPLSVPAPTPIGLTPPSEVRRVGSSLASRRSERHGRRRTLPPLTNKPRLKLSQLQFVNEYLKNGGNGRRAYMTVHPHAKESTAGVKASELVNKGRVKAEIERRMALVERKITREMIEQDLLYARDLAIEQGNPAVLASVIMDCGKATGLITEKKEVTTINQQQREDLRRLVVESVLDAKN